MNDNQNCIFIDGIGIAEYRSFGQDVQRIGPLKKINFFIGQNNCGKSNILLFLNDHYSKVLKNERLDFKDLDYHKGNKAAKKAVEVGLKIGSKNYEDIIARVNKSQEHQHPHDFKELIDKALQSQSLSKGTKVAWFRYIGEGPNAIDTGLLSGLYAEKIMMSSQWQDLWNITSPGRYFVTGPSEETIINTCILEIIRWLSPCNLAPPRINLIPAIRKVDKGSVKSDDFSGIGIIDRLAMLQNAPYDKPEDKTRFERINEFVKSVLDKSSAKLHVPFERNTIEVEIDGKPLPLSNLGMGVHEVIILAAAATVLEKQVVCIEEPELHCHPLLQKQLMKYLNEKTSNQYFISTHSAHILDTPNAAVFHVTLEDGESRVEVALSDTAKSHICDDLGYRASDLLQANSVVWVEGPSDRVYLNHWIHTKAPELIEGLHYSIMFYGGRLLSHLKADDAEIDDFISLRRLNRHITIVIDSDRSSEKDDINPTKKRVNEEFNKGPGFAWVTKGREIENYIKKDILEQAVKDVHPCVIKLRYKNEYGKPLQSPEVTAGTVDLKVDKVKVAKRVVEKEADFNVLDLNEKVEKIVKFIRDANGE